QSVTSMNGSLPVNPSGGLLGANPIGAAGLVRFAEAAMQVRQTAGEHQVDGARLALGHAMGGFSNCVAMWGWGGERPCTTASLLALVCADWSIRRSAGAG